MLSIDELTRRFGEKAAVDKVSLRIERGSFVGVIGRSGAGKSTLLRMVNRLTDPSEGRIVIDGVDVTALRGQALRNWRARCAMIFQQFNLVGRLDVLTNVRGRTAQKLKDAAHLLRSENAGDRRRVSPPGLRVAPEAATPMRRQPVVPGPAVVLGDAPLGRDAPGVFQAMQGLVEGRILDLQGAARAIADEPRHGVAVERRAGERLENEHVQRALQQIHPIRIHPLPFHGQVIPHTK